jgi:hypothetical protein
MSKRKPPSAARRERPHRRVPLSSEILRFISENQQLAGFSGRISHETATHQVDMDAIAASAKRLKAQIPAPQNRAAKPRITRFGSHSA